MFGETVVNSVTGKTVPIVKPHSQNDNGHVPGIVTIIDIKRIGEGQVCASVFID